jgi:hypothetical protein
MDEQVCERNGNQYEHEVYKRNDRYDGRMMFYPFQPGQHRRSHKSGDKSPGRPQPTPETLARSTSGAPK